MNRIYILLLTFILGCISPLDVDVDSLDTQLLVVEGVITTGEGPHIIQLTTTAGYGSLFDGVIGREEGASVSIRSGSGEVEILTEIGDGRYETSSDFRAQVGESYALQIIRNSGREYASIPETVVAVPDIDTVKKEFKEVETGVGLPRSGIEVSVEFMDDPETSNFYLWRYRGTYQIISRPDLWINPETGQVDPLDCCPTCWTDESNLIPNVLQDNALNGAQITGTVGFVEDDGVRFGDKYFMILEHASITANAFQFHQLVKQQLSIQGDIFDPPPATVRGNVIGVTDPDELVIGFFRASDVRVDSLFLFSEDLINPKEPAVIRGDCRIYKPNATIFPPEFWN